MITTNGRNIIQRYLARQVPTIGGSIAVGIGSTASTLSDATLNYEALRVPVSLTSFDPVNQRIIFKATLPSDLAGTYYEIGLYSGVFDSSISTQMLSFDPSIEAWSGGSLTTLNSRMGVNSLRLTAAASATTTALLSSVFYDLSGFYDTDVFKIAFNADANTATVRLRLRYDASSYYEYSITPTTGYNVTSFLRSAMTKTGTTVAWNNITSVEIAVIAKAAGTTNVDFDSLRIENVNVPVIDNLLVARSVLGTPQSKTNVSPMDVEYALDVNIT
jgi:hypothetical protein